MNGLLPFISFFVVPLLSLFTPLSFRLLFLLFSLLVPPPPRTIPRTLFPIPHKHTHTRSLSLTFLSSCVRLCSACVSFVSTVYATLPVLCHTPLFQTKSTLICLSIHPKQNKLTFLFFLLLPLLLSSSFFIPSFFPFSFLSTHSHTLPHPFFSSLSFPNTLSDGQHDTLLSLILSFLSFFPSLSPSPSLSLSLPLPLPFFPPPQLLLLP